MNPTPDPAAGSRYQLWFRPLSNATTAPRAFRCDAAGHIDLDALSELDRVEYLFARALVGRDFDRPAVQGNASHPSQFLAAAVQRAARRRLHELMESARPDPSDPQQVPP